MRKTYVTALIITLACIVWLMTGVLGKPKPVIEPSLADKKQGMLGQAQDAPARVRVRVLHASAQVEDIAVRATTESKRVVEVRSMISGRVAASPVEKGVAVNAGDLLCQLDPADRRAWVAEGEAMVVQAKLEYEGNQKLRLRGYQSETQEKTAKAKLASAEAALQQRQVDLARTSIRAPFAGVVEERQAELGAFLQPGQSCATLVAPDPMLVVGQVAERDVGMLKVGQTASAHLIDGQEVSGKVSFVGLIAQAQTRTYRIEVTVPNASHRIRSGITADLRIPKDSVAAQHLSPAVLALDDHGGVGVRVLDARNIVRFMPVRVIKDDPSGVWVTGLPATTTLITVGQEQVVAGERVQATYEAENPRSEAATPFAAPNQPNTGAARVTQDSPALINPGEPVKPGEPAQPGEPT